VCIKTFFHPYKSGRTAPEALALGLDFNGEWLAAVHAGVLELHLHLEAPEAGELAAPPRGLAVACGLELWGSARSLGDRRRAPCGGEADRESRVRDEGHPEFCDRLVPLGCRRQNHTQLRTIAEYARTERLTTTIEVKLGVLHVFLKVWGSARSLGGLGRARCGQEANREARVRDEWHSKFPDCVTPLGSENT
jgi:hypothetical protein